MSKMLKRIALRVARPFTCLLSTKRLKSTTGGGLICPVYHICRQEKPKWWGDRYRIKKIPELRADLEFLARSGRFLSINELLGYHNESQQRPQGYFLSFDDGYRELHDEVAPLLHKLGIPATFFVVSSIIDNVRPFHEDVAGAIQLKLKAATKAVRWRVIEACSARNRNLESVLRQRTPDWSLLKELCDIVEFDQIEWLKQEQPYLTTCQLRALSNAGFEIGAHSVDHSLFSEIDDNEKLTQVRSSTDAVSNAITRPCRAFAFPYGEFGISKSFLLRLFSENYAELYFGTRGITADEFEPTLIQRILAEDHKCSFPQQIRFELRQQLHRSWNGQETVCRKE